MGKKTLDKICLEKEKLLKQKHILKEQFCEEDMYLNSHSNMVWKRKVYKVSYVDKYKSYQKQWRDITLRIHSNTVKCICKILMCLM